MPNVNQVLSTFIKNFKNRVRQMLTVERPVIAQINGEISTDTLQRIVDIQALIAEHEAQVKRYNEELKPLIDNVKATVIAQGDEYDTVDATIDGIRLHKFPRISSSLNVEKVIELASQKRILSQVSRLERVIDEEKLFAAVQQGAISEQEYVDCLDNKTSQVFKVEDNRGGVRIAE